MFENMFTGYLDITLSLHHHSHISSSSVMLHVNHCNAVSVSCLSQSVVTWIHHNKRVSGVSSVCSLIIIITFTFTERLVSYTNP